MRAIPASRPPLGPLQTRLRRGPVKEACAVLDQASRSLGVRWGRQASRRGALCVRSRQWRAHACCAFVRAGHSCVERLAVRLEVRPRKVRPGVLEERAWTGTTCQSSAGTRLGPVSMSKGHVKSATSEAGTPNEVAGCRYGASEDSGKFRARGGVQEPDVSGVGSYRLFTDPSHAFPERPTNVVPHPR